MSLDSKEFRFALGNFPTGVTIITSVTENGERLGKTINSFSSVSLDPPLILFSLDRAASSIDAYLKVDFFAVNVLSVDQQSLSSQFGGALDAKWDGVPHETWETGAPILSGALASFDCRIWNTYDGGDHVIFIGEVLRMSHDAAAEPLIFFRGRYGALGPKR
jgi:flavin reductase (DIM6/NTAB) family NADH-FMN oxidoreductase RutF